MVISLGSRKQMALGELVNKGESACPEVGEEGNRMEELGNRSVARELGGGGGVSTQLVVCIRYHY